MRLRVFFLALAKLYAVFYKLFPELHFILILTLLKNLAFRFIIFRKKPLFLMRGYLPAKTGGPASIPQIIAHS